MICSIGRQESVSHQPGYIYIYSPIDLAAFITTTYSFCRDDEDLAASATAPHISLVRRGGFDSFCRDDEDLAASAAAPHISLVRRGGFEKSLATGYFDTALFIRAL
jgi:hypothetical protein